MLKKYSLALAMLLILLALPSPDAFGQTRLETVEGEVIAYQQQLAKACFDSICGGSIIVRLNKPQGSSSPFIRIELSHSDNTNLEKSFTGKRKWQFTVVRTIESDLPLKKYFTGIEENTKKESETKIPMWKHIDGEEGLPYGETLRSYRLAKNLTKDIWRRL